MSEQPYDEDLVDEDLMDDEDLDEVDSGGFVGSDVGLAGFSMDGEGDPWSAQLYIANSEQVATVELTPRVLDGLLDWLSTLEAARVGEPSVTERAADVVGWASGWTVADRLRRALAGAPLRVRAAIIAAALVGVAAALVLR